MARSLTMKYAGGVVKHLGLQMYSGPVPAIAELIANAWDAEATKVVIKIPFGEKIKSSSTLSIYDNGEGMTWEDFEQKYMIVGRDARKEDGNFTKGKLKRKRMAHKGLGKLAGFGIATVIEVTSVKNHKRTNFSMDYSAIKKLELGEDYQINVNEDNISTTEKDGTTIKLKELKLKQAISKESFLVSMIRRFSILSDKFKVIINEEELTKKDTPLQIVFPSNRHRVAGEKIVKKKGVYNIPDAGQIKYWIGFTEKPIKDSESRGLIVLARGKLVQEPWFFDVSGGTSGQHGMQYMTGEIEADFLDEKIDFITTGRNSVMWSMPIPNILKKWGHDKVKFVLDKWAEERGRLRLEHVQQATPYLDRINRFPPRPRKELTTVVRRMASIPTIEKDRLVELVRSLINAYENKALSHMIDELSSLSPDAQAKLYEILQEFQVLESVSLAQIVKSHIKIIEKFEEMIGEGVPEKPDMQNYLRDYPWLIDPTYMGLDHEKRLETLLLKHFHHKAKGKDKKKRVDFFCLGELGRAFVIEVKRPQEKIGREEIQQLTRYIDFLRTEDEKITEQESKKTYFGYLIGSSYSEDTKFERERAHSDGIYTKTWDSLLGRAVKSHKQYFDAMKKKIPENDPRLENFE